MPVSANTLRALMAAGVTGDALVTVVEAIDADMGHKPDVPLSRSPAAERQARYRARKAQSATGDVTGDATPPLDKKVSPHPFEETQPPSKSPPMGGQKVPQSDEITEAVQAFNAAAGKCGWPKAEKITPKRCSSLKARIADVGGIEGWKVAMNRAAQSPFLRGEGRSEEHANWRPGLDFFLRSSSFTKLLEGTYDPAKPPTRDDPRPLPTDVLWGQRASQYAAEGWYREWGSPRDIPPEFRDRFPNLEIWRDQFPPMENSSQLQQPAAGELGQGCGGP